MRIDKKLLPIKAHWFFFMAAMGPILPQINVYGKQLGISTVVMGIITGILPILFLVSKPLFGFIVDYFSNLRKAIFMGLLITMCSSYALLHFFPAPAQHDVPDKNIVIPETDYDNLNLCNATQLSKDSQCSTYRRMTCQWKCDYKFSDEINNITTLVYRNFYNTSEFEACLLFNTSLQPYQPSSNNCSLNCSPDNANAIDCIYGTITFWAFVILMFIGTIGFNVANCVSDAICFDVLGDNGQIHYGKQRVWGTIGFGLSALIAGYIIDWLSEGEIKNYTPAFVVMLIFIFFDLLSCFKLKLPPMATSDNIFKDLGKLIKHKHIAIFLVFATLAGIVDSFIIYFLFWYLEELAANTHMSENIKLLEGLTVAAECLGGEVIFFVLSGKIIKKIGFGHSFTMCFICYSIRLGLISLIPSPWWVLPIEFVMQGPTYAMCYTTIVAYASAVSPPGTSATMQGIVAGMDDGFGYALGSLLGGFLYSRLGGKVALQIFSFIALCCGLAHFILYVTILRKSIPSIVQKENDYKSPENAVIATVDATEKIIN